MKEASSNSHGCRGREMGTGFLRSRGRSLFYAGFLLLALFAAGTAWIVSKPKPSWAARGELAYRRGEWSEAAEIARGWLKSRPEDPEGLRLLARSTARLGRDGPANALFSRLGESGLEAEDLYLLGVGLNKAGQGDSAVRLWEKAR